MPNQSLEPAFAQGYGGQAIYREGLSCRVLASFAKPTAAKTQASRQPLAWLIFDVRRK